jgi:hypothetical protein
VSFHTAEGRLSQIPVNFTDLVEPDPYVVVSSGRAYLGLQDLLGLVDLLRELGQEGEKECVNIFMPLPSAVTSGRLMAMVVNICAFT